MNKHPDSDYMSLEVARHNGKRVGAVDLLCWTLALVLLAALGAMWWPQ